MAFGFTPRHVSNLPVDIPDREKFLVIAVETAVKLRWNINFINPSGFIASTRFSMSSWGEEFSLKMEDGTAVLKSECTGSQFVDWGKNRKNIAAFVSKFSETKNSITPEEIESKRS